VRVWSGARVGKNICTFKVNESAVIGMHFDEENGWLIVILYAIISIQNEKV
jgi:hypothetical protein